VHKIATFGSAAWHKYAWPSQHHS